MTNNTLYILTTTQMKIKTRYKIISLVRINNYILIIPL